MLISSGIFEASNMSSPGTLTSTLSPILETSNLSSPQNTSTASSNPGFKDRQNFRVIQGTRKNSKVFVHDNFLYILNKTEDDTLYLKCKYNHTCQATAIVRENYITPNIDKTPHNWEGQQQVSLDKLASVEILKQDEETLMAPHTEAI